MIMMLRVSGYGNEQPMMTSNSGNANDQHS
jgi:hypothetical protein